MTTIKADLRAADRVLTRAVDKAVRMIRDGEPAREYEAVMVAAGVAAGVLMEARS